MDKYFSPVIFDLDGTILDSAPHITSCVAFTLHMLGCQPQTQEQLLRFVGPPLQRSFMEYADLSESQADEAISIYRQRYRVAMLETQAFEGIVPVIASLHSAGIPLAIASSKLEILVNKILAAQGLDRYFEVIAGAGNDSASGSKEQVLRRALSGLESHNIALTRPVLIGDRIHDMQGAKACAIAAIAAAWAPHCDLSEFTYAHAIAHSPSELLKVLGIDSGQGS